jgi:hypothetical protein
MKSKIENKKRTKHNKLQPHEMSIEKDSIVVYWHECEYLIFTKDMKCYNIMEKLGEGRHGAVYEVSKNNDNQTGGDPQLDSF